MAAAPSIGSERLWLDVPDQKWPPHPALEVDALRAGEAKGVEGVAWCVAKATAGDGRPRALFCFFDACGESDQHASARAIPTTLVCTGWSATPAATCPPCVARPSASSPPPPPPVPPPHPLPGATTPAATPPPAARPPRPTAAAAGGRPRQTPRRCAPPPAPHSPPPT